MSIPNYNKTGPLGPIQKAESNITLRPNIQTFRPNLLKTIRPKKTLRPKMQNRDKTPTISKRE